MSPYVAVFFAFSEIIPADMASVFVFIETPTGNKSGFLHEPQIFQYGQHCRTHKRHFLQQACYTIAAKLYTEDGAMEPSFVRHQKIFSQGNNDQDLLFKINIPCSERIKILSHLDEYNVNHFSLIQSEESLVRMVAFREMEKYFNSSIIK